MSTMRLQCPWCRAWLTFPSSPAALAIGQAHHRIRRVPSPSGVFAYTVDRCESRPAVTRVELAPATAVEELRRWFALPSPPETR